MNFLRLLAPVFVVPFFSVRAAGPVIDRIDPPDWWAGHTLNPVRLLVQGHDLSGASIRIPGTGLRIGVPSVNAAGTALVVDVAIPGSAAPGRREVVVSNRDGEARGAFEVRPRLDDRRGGQGFGPDDVVYLIMPDRFADGDETNDNTAKAPGLSDRRKPRHSHGGDLRGVIQHLDYL